MTAKRGQLPFYSPEDNGIDEDILKRATDYDERLTRDQVSRQGRRALLAKLNDSNSGIASLAGLPPVGRRPGSPGDSHVPRIVMYLRVSTEEQAKVGGEIEGFSIPFQRDACLQKTRELGGVMVAEYVDAGESAKSANRPQLQLMLGELKAKRIDFVIVHKIDRLARNRADDVAINAQILSAGAKLMSVAEPIDETPAGKLLYGMLAGVAQYHSDNLAVEVMKGMSTKAKLGGTPGRPPLGYLNRQDVVDGIVIRTVAVDHERAPLVRWAFKQYALGSWSLSRLLEALTAQGLTTRPTAKRPAKPLTIHGLNFMLRHPYYFGVVPFCGIFYEGKHDALVDVQLWLRVQEILTAHRVSGDKQFKYEHYLKGSVFCGQCGSRLVYSRNRGRGGVYEYFDCISKKVKRHPCNQRAVRLHKVEAGVEQLYDRIHLTAERARQIQQSVLEELRADRVEVEREVQRATKQLRDVKDQQEKLLQAHYAGAVPLELMKAEMERILKQKAAAELAIASAQSSATGVEGILHKALIIATSCHQQYLTAVPRIRRRLNQGFFKKLYIDEAGQVSQFEMTEPFATLLDQNLLVGLGRPAQAQSEPEDAKARDTLVATPPVRSNRAQPSVVFERTFVCESRDQPGGGAVRLGLNIVSLVTPG